MQQLWAPWRMTYLTGETRSEGCFLCALGAGPAAEAPDLVVWRGRRVYALLNAFPYANGHVMVAPYEHEGDLAALDDEAAGELMAGIRRVIRALRLTYQPQAFNVGANLGPAAGAGYGDHVHVHVVPRWSNDTNFMTATAATRVIPEALADTADRVRAALNRIE
jgi:ATP adenylyltransferase